MEFLFACKEDKPALRECTLDSVVAAKLLTNEDSSDLARDRKSRRYLASAVATQEATDEASMRNVTDGSMQMLSPSVSPLDNGCRTRQEEKKA